ncbi:hypothetical protein [Nesterenkonia sp.]|uniref:hypothetical protein n=1 Tax=Nesterenkonia sp. TaxID=704201 RepID=UPI00262A7A33|nr:hypothetical protein [Nesterenkonia sp.]
MNAFGILVLIFGCVLAAVLFVAGMVWVGRLASGGTPSGVLDRVQTLELLADVSAEAHA